jgi:hypothetical protein
VAFNKLVIYTSDGDEFIILRHYYYRFRGAGANQELDNQELEYPELNSQAPVLGNFPLPTVKNHKIIWQKKSSMPRGKT